MGLTTRFWEKVSRDPDGCWRWSGTITTKGYGVFWLDGRNRRAHRVAYEAMVGEIPQELQLDHLCRVRSCVNPAHLEPVTARENTKRGNTGENHRSKTACPAGHAYDSTNTHINTRGARVCKTCNRDKARRIRQQKMETQAWA